jgi:hypothetical protein
MEFKSIGIEKIGGDINQILKVIYNQGLENERILFYDYDEYHIKGWSEKFNMDKLITKIKEDINKVYGNS